MTAFVAALAACVSILSNAHDDPIDPQRIDARRLDEAVRHYANEARGGVGLPCLAEDEALRDAAEGHAQDMAEKGFFSHASPVRGRKTMADRLKAAGAEYRVAGENLYQTQLFAFGDRPFYVLDQKRCRFSFTPDGPPVARHTYRSLARTAVDAWMESPGHRKNLLMPEAVRGGHGAAIRRSENCGDLYVVQNVAG